MQRKYWIVISTIIIILAGGWIFYYLSWQSYTNDALGYTIRYPDEWIRDPDKSLIDEVNTIYSIVNLYDKSMRNSVSIQVSANDLTLPLQSQAFKIEPVKVASTTVTAFIFKSEYNECGAGPTEQCAYFLIPIKYNNLWYTLSAGGKLQGYEGIYKRIISTFKLL